MATRSQHDATLSPDKRALYAIRRMQSQLDELEGRNREPIAIVGLACRFPGGANTPGAYWEMLAEGRSGTGPPPEGHNFDIPGYFREHPAESGRELLPEDGGFLSQVDHFDPEFFGIAPREAELLDPQQRLLLEVTWECLENAGLRADSLRGSRTGVFVGVSSFDYASILAEEHVPCDPYLTVGNSHSILAGRLSYLFDWKGPAFSVDTACSSSLVATHLACRTILAGECDQAVVGGVNALLGPGLSIAFAKGGFLAKDGRCKTFDADADGYVRGEGCGVLFLKRLSAALEDEDHILALVRGSAINQDGKSAGLTAPNGLAQREVIRAALRSAGASPDELGYVEAHGTGTPLGDPIEIEALSEVLSDVERAHGEPCVVASVKTNIGHLEAASGVAGLIKTSLALQHEAIPPHLHLKQLNPDISLEGTPLVIPTECRPWPRGERRRIAGVSSFGFGGTNAHVILEEAPTREESSRPTSVSGPVLLPLSARSDEALRQLSARTGELMAARRPVDLAWIRELSRVAGVRRSHHERRVAIVADEPETLGDALALHAEAKASPRIVEGRSLPGRRHKVAFVFSGQGSQWWGMGRELLECEPVFREVMERVDAAVVRHAGWSLLDILSNPDQEARLEDTEVVQPAIFAMQVALAALWRDRGIDPVACVGHSVGEIAAAQVAGAFDLDAAVRTVVRRGRIMQPARGRGRMLAVELDAEACARVAAPYSDRVALAAENAPRSCVLSGDELALKEIQAQLDDVDAYYRWVRVDYAFHSPQMQTFRQELVDALSDVDPREAECLLVSTVTGEEEKGSAFDAAYWGRNLCEPVRFARAIETLAGQGVDTFIEIGGHPVLQPALRECLDEWDADAIAVGSLRRGRPEAASLLDALAQLYVRGFPIDWTRLHDGNKAAGFVHLPNYPWQHRRVWARYGAGAGLVRMRQDGDGGMVCAHPLLSRHVESGLAPGTHVWETELSLESVPYLRDHAVGGGPVFPASGYLELAAAAAVEHFGAGPHVVEGLRFESLLPVPENAQEQLVLQVVLVPDGDDRGAVRVFSHAPLPGSPFTQHAVGCVRAGDPESDIPRAEEPLEQIFERCGEAIEGEALYAKLSEQGLAYGPGFQGVLRIWRGDGEALSRVRLPELVSTEGYRVHPALLDAAFHTVAACLPEGDEGGGVYLPAGVGEFMAHAPAPREFFAHARMVAGGDPEGGAEGDLHADVVLRDGHGQIVVEVRGLWLKRLDTSRVERVEDWLYEPQWTRQDRSERTPGPKRRKGLWILVGSGADAARALRDELEARGERVLWADDSDSDVSLDDRDGNTVARWLSGAVSGDSHVCGVVHFHALSAPRATDVDALRGVQRRVTRSALAWLQGLARREDPPRVWIVTRGAEAVVPEDDATLRPELAPLWGLGRVAALELPEVRCTRVDLPAECDLLEERDLPEERNDFNALLTLVDEFMDDGAEDQIALRRGGRFVQRLGRATPPPLAAVEVPLEPAEARGFRLEIEEPGVLDRLALREHPIQEPGHGEVAIDVRAAGLNFKDVLLALGVVPSPLGDEVPLGGECAGIVRAVGDGVQHVRPGDAVVAIGPHCFGRHVVVSKDFVMPKPSVLTFEEAAGVSQVFMTASHALLDCGRLCEGERVLIHAAAGGVGMAAVQVARAVGAEVFATAGSDAKRDFLRGLGIEHVMDSRSLDFAEETLAATDGRGVDLVLNSLSGEAIDRNFDALAPYGRFIEIGVRDVYANRSIGLWPFHKNLSYHAIELSRMLGERPAALSRLFGDVLARFDAGELTPIPVEAFPIEKAQDAFRFMAQARQVGKIVLTVPERADDVPIAPPRSEGLREDATYLVTGGLGGLGLCVAEWLVDRGARHLALLGRSAPSPTAQETLARLEDRGVTVHVVSTDVSDADALADALAALRRQAPPLRGAVHAAGVLDDGILLQQDWSRFERVFAPKVDGAFHLDRLTREDPLDFFVLFSSIASLTGSPGQANYSAANAFLDALARRRRGEGLPGLAVAWGPWAEVGMAAADAKRGKRMATQGLPSLSPADGLAVLDHLLGRDAVVVGAVCADLGETLGAFPELARLPLLAALAEQRGEETGVETSAFRQRLEKLVDAEALHEAVEHYLRDEIAAVLRLDPLEIEGERPLSEMGFDSLMAVELKNRIERGLGIALSPTLLFRFPTLDRLAPGLVEKMGLARADESEAASGTEDNAPSAPVMVDVESMTDDEARALLTGGG